MKFVLLKPTPELPREVETLCSINAFEFITMKSKTDESLTKISDVINTAFGSGPRLRMIGIYGSKDVKEDEVCLGFNVFGCRDYSVEKAAANMFSEFFTKNKINYSVEEFSDRYEFTLS